jgi:hypothetical protein
MPRRTVLYRLAQDSVTTTKVIGSGPALDGLPPQQQVPQPPTPRLRTRANKGTWQSTKYRDETWLAEVYTKSDEKLLFQQDEHLAYHLAALALDMDTGLLDVTSPMIYGAARKRKDPDTPGYALAMSGNNKEEYLVLAMQMEITELKAKDTWTLVPHTDTKGSNILPSTWAFKKKRYPDGRARKFKARFCCRGDSQLEGVDYFEAYAPTVGWSTIRLLLTMTLANGWDTMRQVDYTNTFAQAEIKETVFVELPRDFAASESKDQTEDQQQEPPWPTNGTGMPRHYYYYTTTGPPKRFYGRLVSPFPSHDVSHPNGYTFQPQ